MESRGFDWADENKSFFSKLLNVYTIKSVEDKTMTLSLSKTETFRSVSDDHANCRDKVFL